MLLWHKALMKILGPVAGTSRTWVVTMGISQLVGTCFIFLIWGYWMGEYQADPPSILLPETRLCASPSRLYPPFYDLMLKVKTLVCLCLKMEAGQGKGGNNQLGYV